MSKMYRVTAQAATISFCCGVQTLGNFAQGRHAPHYAPLIGEGASYQAAWQDLLSKYLRASGSQGRAVQLWFKKYPTTKGYEAAHLRKLVQKLPGVVHLCEPYVNPNSGNTIDGYLFFNDGKIVIPTGEKSE